MDKETNWEEIAKRLLHNIKEVEKHNKPKPLSILLEYRSDIYIGSLQEISPEYSREIVLLSKSTNPLKGNIVKAIEKLEPERPYFHADSSLDLEGRQHILRRLENKLIKMTPEQAKYITEHLPQVHEI